MLKPIIYAGIGSRDTPHDILNMMSLIARELAPFCTLRSGHADGADRAFESGCIAGNGKKEIYLPWEGFNCAPTNNPDYICMPSSLQATAFAAMHHPAWERCSQAAKKLHTRNVAQIYGAKLNSPVDLVICWTKEGKRKGGTGQALRMAEAKQIPIFDLALPETEQNLTVFFNNLCK